ncbi:DMT family transporter [Parendozoicomonas haliclonae]|uniref:Putative inner membrane transporter yiJE n=1 Tax=Parendozoicomonas haliclonae TaxID=1960125 RepID=A0A1X7APK4_9GAMM|nr:DMT family transporter [Parendozoicomonas haliclonae]SMA50030.1 putative inner membrane transporter yiJE [Parendozoicomonas haliclonae]
MTASITPTMNAKAWAFLIVLSLLWGGSFFFNGVAVRELPPLSIVTLRVSLAAVALWAFVIAIGLRPPFSLKIWGAFLGMGLLNNVFPFALIVWGQTQIASGLAAILNAATPIFAVIVAGLLLPDERPTPLKLLGVFIGFIGVVVMIGVPALDDSGTLLAQLAVVCATIFYAFAGVYGRRFKTLGINPLITAAGQVTASAVVLIPVALLIDGPEAVQTTSVDLWIALTGLAILSTALAYVLYFKILELAGATNVLLVTLLVPVSAVILGILFLDETLEGVHLLGILMIALGLSVIDGRLWQHLRARKT